MSFHVGQKVVCVDASKDSVGRSMPLSVGAIYTIIYIGHDDFGGTGFLLAEASIAKHPLKTTRFKSSRFRPIIKDRKSVSFTIGAPKDSERWDNRKKIKEKI